MQYKKFLEVQKGAGSPDLLKRILNVLTFWVFPLKYSLMKEKRNLPSMKKKPETGLFRLLLNGLHAYIYGRWTKRYIKVLLNSIIPRLSPRGKIKLTNGFHCKVLSHENAKSIITIDRKIPLQDLEQIIPFPRARYLVLNGPPEIVLYECSCRLTRENPCQPTQVCMIIGKPFTDFILKHHPGTSRRINQEEALEILHAEHERGHVHTAWFKDAMGDRFYALCNCCKCCCFGITAMLKYSTSIIAPSGYIAKVDEIQCTVCGTCQEVCPFQAIELNGNPRVMWEACMGCGVCVGQCPNKAMSLELDSNKGLPMDVGTLNVEG